MPPRLSTANPPQRLASPSVCRRHPDQGLHPLCPAASLASAYAVRFSHRRDVQVLLLVLVSAAETVLSAIACQLSSSKSSSTSSAAI